MTKAGERTDVIAELESLRQRLDESLVALAGRDEHVPMHDVVGGLIRRVMVQNAEIADLRRRLDECLALRGPSRPL